MLIVAVLTYLSLKEAGASDTRVVNGFLGALFHDLPEVLTRDITSPIKSAVEGLDAIIKEYEKKQMEDRLLPLLPTSWHPEIMYFTEDEFSNRALVNGKTVTGLSFEDLSKDYDAPEFWPVDGEIIRCCDHLAAFIEASLSIKHGISTKHLAEGVERLYSLYKDKEPIAGKLDFARVFREFLPNK
jgi:putative hydrolase of HD superfamily